MQIKEGGREKRKRKKKKKKNPLIDQIDYLTLRPRPCRFLPLILKEIAASSNWKKFSLKIGLSKGGRRGERDPPELHQRTLGCTSLTSTCVNNSLLFLSFLLPRFRSSVSLSLSQFSKFHLLSPLLPSFTLPSSSQIDGPIFPFLKFFGQI